MEIVSRFVNNEMVWAARRPQQVHERRSTTALIITILCGASDHYRPYSNTANTDHLMLYRITITMEPSRAVHCQNKSESAWRLLLYQVLDKEIMWE